MKRRPILVLFVLGMLTSSAGAQGNLTPPQILRHDASLTGAGTSPSPAGVHVATGGGLTTNGGTTGVGLGVCPTGQVWQSIGATYACADGASLSVAGTAGHVPYYAPDGHHLGDSPVTWDGSTNLDMPVPRIRGYKLPSLGTPPYTGSAVTSGAGVLTGTCSYVYTELADSGESAMSAPWSVVASSNAIDVTTPLPRRGVERHATFRNDCSGGTTYKLVHEFDGGSHYYASVWHDNVAFASLGRNAPTVDTSVSYSMDVSHDLLYFRGAIDAPGTFDAAFLTSDPFTIGAYAQDVYGPIRVRTQGANGSVLAEHTGTGGYLFYGDWISDTDSGQSPTTVWQVGGRGSTLINPVSINDLGSNFENNALFVNATLPSPATQNHTGALFFITSAGSSSFEQHALDVTLFTGYTGSSDTYAASITNGTATTGTAYGLMGTTTQAAGKGVGVRGMATGAAGTSVGTSGIATAGTHQIGLFGGIGTGSSTSHDGTLVLDNGTSQLDLIAAYDSRSGSSLKFEVTGAGAVFGSGAYLTSDNSIGFAPGTNARATAFYGFYGYAPGNVAGTTQYRDEYHYNGKGAETFSVTADTLAADFLGALDAASLTTGGASGSKWSKGTGAPAISCSVGDIFSRTDGGVGTSLYLCTAANTWTADGTSATTGTVASVATGAGLTGGTITTTGTLSLNINGGSTQTCSAGQAATSLTGVGIVSCSPFLTNSSLSGVSGQLAVFNGTNTATGYTGLTTDTSGNLSANQLTIVSTGNYAWGTGDTKIHGVNGATSGAGITMFTNSTLRFTIDGTGAATLAGALAMSSNKITGLANGAAGSDAAAFGQIATGVNAAVSGTSGRVAVFNATNAVTGYAGFLSDSSGNVTANQLTIATTGNYFWGDLSTKIHGVNGSTSGAGITFFTNSTRYMGIDGTGLVTVGSAVGTSSATGTQMIVAAAGTACSEVRDTTDSVETERCVSASGGFDGTFTNHSYFIQTNATNALKIDTSQQVEALQAFKVDGNTTIGNANTNTLTVTAKINSHLYYNGTAPTYSCAGATVDTGSTDERGRIVTPDTSCTLTFAVAYTTNAPFCTANASSNIAVGVATTLTTAVFTMASKPTSMTWACDGGL